MMYPLNPSEKGVTIHVVGFHRPRGRIGLNERLSGEWNDSVSCAGGVSLSGSFVVVELF